MRRSTPEETAALLEKANQEHYRVLTALSRALLAAAWTDIEEIPSAIDLRAKSPDAKMSVIFEVKTLSDSNEVGQCRAALSQLLEYRFFFGQPSDRLCLVVNDPIDDRRRAFLEELDIAIIRITEEGTLLPVGRLAADMFPIQALNGLTSFCTKGWSVQS